jgi:hypothetical protein
MIRIVDTRREVDIHGECALECFSRRPLAGRAGPYEADCEVIAAPVSARRLLSRRNILVAKQRRRFGSQDGVAP